MRHRRVAALATSAVLALLVSACAVPVQTLGDLGGAISAVGAESQYANVIEQIGGPYVRVTAIMSNPNTDPHTFEASPRVAQEISMAQLVVQNGLGYDTFMTAIEDAAPNPGRKVIDVRKLLRLPKSTPNPHLWYKPATMPAVAQAVAADLAGLDPAHASFFRARQRRFTASLATWDSALASLRADFPHVAVATTEPVADYLLQAAGVANMTPWVLQADIMNGVDPSPQAIATQRALLAGRKVRALVYNQQVTDPLTQSFVTLARASGIPVVGVYETMPAPGYDYQRWMLAEVAGLRRAFADGTSTRRL